MSAVYHNLHPVIPAKAGTQGGRTQPSLWAPASAGATN
jgi:hypothetical protein